MYAIIIVEMNTRVYRIFLDKIYDHALETCDGYDELYEILDRWDDASVAERDAIKNRVKQLEKDQLDQSIHVYTYGSWIVYLFVLSISHFVTGKDEDEIVLPYAANLLLFATLYKRIHPDHYREIVCRPEGMAMVENILIDTMSNPITDNAR